MVIENPGLMGSWELQPTQKGSFHFSGNLNIYKREILLCRNSLSTVTMHELCMEYIRYCLLSCF